MEEQREVKEPLLTPSFNGWAAHGDGWAVHGITKEEAIENFWKADQRRREILAQTTRYKYVEVQT